MSDEATSAEQLRTSSGQGVIALLVDHPVASNLLMTILLLAGLYAFLNLAVQDLPELDPREITVTVPLPTATADEVAQDITQRIEGVLLSVEGVRRVRSEAVLGKGTVIADIALFADAATVFDDITRAVQSLEDFPPQWADEVEIFRGKSMGNLLTVAVKSEYLEEGELAVVTEKVREILQDLPLVATVTQIAGPKQEISIEVREETLKRHSLSIEEVVRKVRLNSIDLPSGTIHTSAANIQIGTESALERSEEYAEIVILSNPDGTQVRLRDIASIHDVLTSSSSIEVDGWRAHLLGVRSGKGEEPIEVAEQVRAELETVQVPSGVAAFVWDDRTHAMEERMSIVVSSGILGFALVFLLLALVFDLRVALWVAIGVPASFLGASLLFSAFDITLNLITMFGFVIAIGLVVDDAIIVGESIETSRERGLTGRAAALAGAREVFGPVLAGTVTTIVAFMPLYFVYGDVGQLVSILPIIIALILLVSLAEAFLVLPSHLSSDVKWSRPPLASINQRVHDAIDELRDRLVLPAVSASVRHPWPTIGICVTFVAVVAIAAWAGAVRGGFLDPIPAGRLQADLTFEPQTLPETTRAAAEELVRAAEAIASESDTSPFSSFSLMVGRHFDLDEVAAERGRETGGHLASVVAHLHPQLAVGAAERLEHQWRRQVGQLPGAKSVHFRSAISVSAPDVAVILMHPDRQVLNEAGYQLVDAYRNDPSLFEILHSLAPGERQFDIKLTAEGMAAGFNSQMVGQQLRARYYGAEVERIQGGREEIRVMVRYPAAERQSTEALIDDSLLLPDGTSMPLVELATITETVGPALRLRHDGIPAIAVTARVDKSLASVRDVNNQLVDQVLPALETAYPDIRIRLAGNAYDRETLIEALQTTVPIALLLIYFVAAVFLGSYLRPLLVLAAIPLTVTGALLGHAALGYEMGMVSLMGVLAVSGIALNDAFVLMHRFRKIQLSQPMPAIAGISAAVRQRFRAIVLTTATTIIGVLPLLLSESETTRNLLPLVVSLVSGLLTASIGLLFLMPAVLLLAENAQERWGFAVENRATTS